MKEGIALNLIMLVIIMVSACSFNEHNIEEQPPADQFVYEDVVLDGDLQSCAEFIFSYDSGDPGYKRVTYKYEDGEHGTIDFIVEDWDYKEVGNSQLEAVDLNYESNADSYNDDGTTGEWDRKRVAVYSEHPSIPEGAVARVYSYTTENTLYLLTMEQHYLTTEDKDKEIDDMCDKLINIYLSLIKENGD